MRKLGGGSCRACVLPRQAVPKSADFAAPPDIVPSDRAVVSQGSAGPVGLLRTAADDCGHPEPDFGCSIRSSASRGAGIFGCSSVRNATRTGGPVVSQTAAGGPGSLKTRLAPRHSSWAMIGPGPRAPCRSAPAAIPRRESPCEKAAASASETASDCPGIRRSGIVTRRQVQPTGHQYAATIPTFGAAMRSLAGLIF